MRKTNYTSGLFFSESKTPRISTNPFDENKVSPVPQIIISDFSTNKSSLTHTMSSTFNKNYLIPIEIKRSRSFSPNPCENSLKTVILPPSSPSLKINVKIPNKNLYNKRRIWLMEKQDFIKKKSIEISRKIEELKFLRERNQFLNSEMKNIQLERNKAAISEKFKDDYRLLNGLFYDLLKVEEKLKRDLKEKQSYNGYFKEKAQ